MKQKKITDMSNEELLKYEKLSKLATGVFGGILMVLFAMNIFLFFKDGFSASTVVPFALLPLLFLNYNMLKEVKKEKLARGL